MRQAASGRGRLLPAERLVVRRAVAVPALALAVLGCQGAAPAVDMPAASPVTATASGCDRSARLSSVLAQLERAEDAAAFARARGLRYEPASDRVLVVIQLAEDEGDLAAAFGLEVQARNRGLIQALAPLDTLCGLAADPRVQAVRAPSAAGTQ